MANKNQILVARVLSQDDDFITLEVGKHDKVSWHVGRVPGEAEDSPPQEFLFMVFVTNKNGRMEQWLPWEPDTNA